MSKEEIKIELKNIVLTLNLGIEIEKCKVLYQKYIKMLLED